MGGETDISIASEHFGDIAPDLARLTDGLLLGEIWRRTVLSPRDRSLVTISALVALGRPAQLEYHIRLALENGVTDAEVIEVLTHLAFYSGWPSAVEGVSVARRAFAAKDAV